jgi:molybdenum cofactor cytidylyltransferase
LGQPKQLLQINGQSLVRRAAMAAIDAGCTPIIVVLGASASAVAAELESLPVQLVNNENWSAGMGTSLRAGARALIDFAPSVSGAIVLLCDQPRVTANVIRQLVDEWRQSGQPMAASAYDPTTLGPPCCFAREQLNRFESLPNHSGAKAMLESEPSAVHRVEWPDGRIDIDTADDWRRFS